jgi:MFS family permease
VIQAISFLLSGPFARATLTNFLFFMGLNHFVLLPIYIHHLGGTEADIGLVQGVYSATGIVAQPLIGQLVDRVGRRFFMLLGAGLVAGASAMFLVTASVPVFGLLRGLHGLGFSSFFIANYVHIVDLVPVERRGWALGIFGLSGLVATALAPLGELVLRRLGFPASVVLATVLSGLAFASVLSLRGVRPPMIGTAPEHALREGLGELLRLHMGLAFFFGLGTGVIFTFLPTFAELLGVRGLGLFYTAYAGAAMLVRVAGGELIDTLGRRAVIIPSMGIQALAACILALLAIFLGPGMDMPVLPFLFLAGFLAGGAHGFLYPALSALLMDVTPEPRRGTVVGIFSSVFLVGNAVGAMVFGYAAHGLGYRLMWSLLTVVLVAGFVVSFRLRVGRRARRVARAAPAQAGARETHDQRGGARDPGLPPRPSPSEEPGRSG